MLYTSFYPDMYFWLIGAISSLVFSLVIAFRLKGQKSKIKTYMQAAFLLGGIAYLFWLVPLFFTRDTEVYRVFFVIGDVISHGQLFTFGLLFWELALRRGDVARAVYRTLLTILIAGSAITNELSLWKGVSVSDDAVLYNLEGIAILLFAGALLPVFGMGAYLMYTAFRAINLRSRIRAATISITALVISGSIIFQYVSDFFMNDQMSSNFDISIAYAYLFFLVLNLAALFFEQGSTESK